MPYIKNDSRVLYEDEINSLVDKLVEVFDDASLTKVKNERAGHLNYILTVLLLRFYRELAQRDNTNIRYSDYNEIIGMLECCKLEFYRRQAGPYEDDKIKSEGDVS
jgi:restriction endonuclease Mrr